MNLPYSHNVFGLNVNSEFKLDELITGTLIDEPVIEIFQDDFSEPEKELPNTFYGSMQTFNSDFFYLHLPDQAKFLLTQDDHTTKIKIKLLEGYDFSYVKSWLYGSVLTAALQMNNRFAIHASAVIKDNQLYLFCGNSGIGKSTMASQLHTRGYPIFSDDKCVLFWDKKLEEYFSYPSLKITRLWENSADELSDDSFIHSPSKVALKANKFQFLIEDKDVINSSKKVHSIYRIHNGFEGSTLQLFHPNGIQKIKQLRNQTHRLNYVTGLGKQKIHWDYMQQIVQNIPYKVINRPQGTTISEFVDFVEQNVMNH